MLIESNIPCDLTEDLTEETLNHLVYLKNLGYDGAVLNHKIEEKKLKEFKKIKKISINKKIFKNSKNLISPLRLNENKEFEEIEFKIYKRLTVILTKGDTLVKSDKNFLIFFIQKFFHYLFMNNLIF